MLRTDQTASPSDTVDQPTEQHDQKPASGVIPSQQQPAPALSGLLDLSHRPERSRATHSGIKGAEKRPISPDAFGETTQAYAKKARPHADRPSPNGRRDTQSPDRPFGPGTEGAKLPRTEGIQPLTSSGRSAEPMGGKVVDVPNLPTLQGQPDEWAPAQIRQINHTIETELARKHHPVKVLGYHVTPEQNVESLRAEGFSAEKHQGKSGGVAGTNIHGPGLYISDRPTSDYARADGHDRMFAVVVPKNGFRKSGERPTSAWESGQRHSSADTSHYMESMPAEYKILPAAIPQVGLVPIAHIPPSMSSALLAERATMLAKPALPSGVSPELHKWITGAIAGHPALKNIGAQTDEDKRASIQRVANQLDGDWAKPDDATKERLLADLKARYSIPD